MPAGSVGIGRKGAIAVPERSARVFEGAMRCVPLSRNCENFSIACVFGIEDEFYVILPLTSTLAPLTMIFKDRIRSVRIASCSG